MHVPKPYESIFSNISHLPFLSCNIQMQNSISEGSTVVSHLQSFSSRPFRSECLKHCSSTDRYEVVRYKVDNLKLKSATWRSLTLKWGDSSRLWNKCPQWNTLWKPHVLQTSQPSRCGVDWGWLESIVPRYPPYLFSRSSTLSLLLRFICDYVLVIAKKAITEIMKTEFRVILTCLVSWSTSNSECHKKDTISLFHWTSIMQLHFSKMQRTKINSWKV